MSSGAAPLALGMALPGAYCLAPGRCLSWRWALVGLLGASALAAWVAGRSCSPYGSALAALMLLALYALVGQMGHDGDTMQTATVLAAAMAAAWALGLGAALAMARHSLAGGLGMLLMGLMCSYVFIQMMGFAGGPMLTYGGVIALASALRGGPRPPATAQNA